MVAVTMNSEKSLFLIAVGFLLQIHFFAGAAETFGSLKLERDVLLVEANKPRDKFQEQYLASLQRLKEEATSLGQLKKVEAITAEQSNFEKSSRELDTQFPDLRALQEIYREKIVPIETERLKHHHRINDEYIKRLREAEKSFRDAGDTEEADNIGKALNVEMEVAFEAALSGGVPFVEEFDAPLSSTLWSWAPMARVVDSSLEFNGVSREFALRLEKKISGDFKIEIEIERAGDHTWEWFDCGVHLDGVLASAGVRLAYQDVNLVYVTPSPEGSGAPGNPDDADVIRESHRGNITDLGTFTVVLRNGQLTTAFRDSNGREIQTDPLAVRDHDETGVIIFCGGVPDTPRKIHRVTISRDFSSED